MLLDPKQIQYQDFDYQISSQQFSGDEKNIVFLPSPHKKFKMDDTLRQRWVQNMEWREVELGEYPSPWRLERDDLFNFPEILSQFTILFSHGFYLPDFEDSHDVNLLEAVKAAKILCGQHPRDYLEARGRLNPYECLGKGPKQNPFLNRSALKLANLDYLFGLLPSHNSPSSSEEIFTWADICGGPGGFSEYILTAPLEGMKAIGFGMSLAFPTNPSSSCNWNLTHYHDPPNIAILTTNSLTPPDPPSQRLFTILHGADSTGNILYAPNIDSFCEAIHAALPPMKEEGVCFFCGDGGMEEGRDKDDQETIHLPLILSQIIAMIGSLQFQGQFIIKTFTQHQPATILVVSLLSHIFEELSIVKPITSRPTSSERYIFCQGFKKMSRTERRELQELLWRYQHSISAPCPPPSGTLTAPSLSLDSSSVWRLNSFYRYVRETNDSLLLIQLHSFLKIFHHLILEKDWIWSSDGDQKIIKRMKAAVSRYAMESAGKELRHDSESVLERGNKRQRMEPERCDCEETMALDLQVLSTSQLECMEEIDGLLSDRHPSLSSLRKKKKIRAVDYFREWGFL